MAPKPKRQEIAAVDGTHKNNPNRKKAIVPTRSERPDPSLLIQGDELALAIWHETCDQLSFMGFLTLEDKPILESYTLNYALLLRCIQSLVKDGDTDVTREGGTRASGHATNYQRYMQTHIKLLSELGLTPSARVKLAPPESRSSQEDNPVGDLLKKLAGG